MSRPIYPESSWRWFGNAAHFICGRWCRFHLATLVGEHLISTVGEYVHPRHSQGRERAEAIYLVDNPLGENIGCDRKFETYVFVAGEPCDAAGCNCGMPTLSNGCEIEGIGCNTRREATENHMAMCRKYANVRHAAKVCDE